MDLAIRALSAGQPAPGCLEAVRRALADHLRAKGYLPARDDPKMAS